MKNLCLDCKHADVVRGHKEDQVKIYCHQSYFTVLWPVKTCSNYIPLQQPRFVDMEQIAWKVRIDERSKKILGFVPPKGE